MKQVRMTKFGGPEVMEVAEVAMPEPGQGEVRVKVEAAGLNYSDIMIREGQYIDAMEPPLPLGRECCGTIDKLGAGVTNYKEGQRVVATVPAGAFAEYVVTNAAGLLPCPEGLSPEQAASIFIQGLTAVHCLTDLAQTKKGETVLIQAAAGGVGTLAVQIARELGAKVFGTASSDEKCKTIEELGGTAINYSKGDWVAELKKANGGRGADVILESVGGDVFLRSFNEALEPFGRLVVYGVAGREIVSLTNREILESNKTIMGYYLGSYFPAHMDKIMSGAMRLMQMIGQGKVKPIVGEVFPLDRAVDAFNHMQQRKNVGKVIIKP